MALIGCNMCEHRTEIPLDRAWICSGCGDSYGLFVEECSEKEVNTAFGSLIDIRNRLAIGGEDWILPFTVASTGQRGDQSAGEDAQDTFSRFVDTMLLLLPTLVFRDIGNSQIAEQLGDRKFEDYHRAGLIRTIGTYNWPEDENIVDIEIFGRIRALDEDLMISTFRMIENLSRYVHARELTVGLLDAGLLPAKPDSDGMYAMGTQKYSFSALTGFLPHVVCRSELACFLTGATLLVDDYYSLLHRARRSWDWMKVQQASEAELFIEWLRSHSLAFKKLDADAVLEFREKHKSLAPFLKEISFAARRSVRHSETKNLQSAFAAELDKRIEHARKMLSKEQDKKAFILTGLLSTLGGLLGGTEGAFVGGIGGRLATQLALEYDKRIPGPLTFILEHIA
jgi:hypothetical protein